ncbi:hypothetical protein NSPZN2_40640 [Nitrospira defluvii]|uniref:Uncharacterized protein n=1 Tax=Nitrospira defluvii TaxID=330214 RepID=A0ABN7M5P9_9BACT|nr:hypothetical protein NSPZN2_40640 [Nitrospira defluvii]
MWRLDMRGSLCSGWKRNLCWRRLALLILRVLARCLRGACVKVQTSWGLIGWFGDKLEG